MNVNGQAEGRNKLKVAFIGQSADLLFEEAQHVGAL